MSETTSSFVLFESIYSERDEVDCFDGEDVRVAGDVVAEKRNRQGSGDTGRYSRSNPTFSPSKSLPKKECELAGPQTPAQTESTHCCRKTAQSGLKTRKIPRLWKIHFSENPAREISLQGRTTPDVPSLVPAFDVGPLEETRLHFRLSWHPTPCDGNLLGGEDPGKPSLVNFQCHIAQAGRSYEPVGPSPSWQLGKSEEGPNGAWQGDAATDTVKELVS